MLLSLYLQSRPTLILKLVVCGEHNISLGYAKPKLGKGKFTKMLKPFDNEFQPFIEEFNLKEKEIQEFAGAATMERVRSMILHL